MAENQTPMVLTKAPPLPKLTEELTPIQRGWLQMSWNRDWTMAELQKGELKVQELLKLDENTKLEVIQEKLKEAKEVATEAQEKRKFFTKVLKEKLIDKLMEFEKRNDLLIASATELELKVRIAANKKKKEEEDKALEVRMYKAHIENEYKRVEALYILALQNRITFYYNQSLKDKKRNKKELNEYMDMIAKELPNIPKEKGVPYQRVYVTKDEAMAIIKQVTAPDFAQHLEDAIQSIPSRFEMYAQDFKNADAAIKAAELEQQQKASDVQKELASNASISNLVAAAEPVTTIAAPGGPKIAVKKTYSIVLDNTADCALKVMTHFITNMNECQKKLLIKDWSNLSIEKMANALSKYANDFEPVKQFDGLSMKEVMK